MKKCFFLGMMLFMSLYVFAQRGKTAAPPPPTFDATIFEGLKWRNIGPFRGGRANAVSGLPGNDQVFFAGYTGGGLWKTVDAGISWHNISDGFFKTGSVGAIAVSEADPNVIYVGMGEHAIRGVMTSYGDGVYKSTDGGKTWKNVGLEKTRHISDVVIHPSNPEIVFVAAQGTAHGPNEDRGIFKSSDGGNTWKKVLFVDANTGAASLSMDITNPRILYAATWEHRRLPWQVQSGGPGCSIWKSVDGGDTWSKINTGLPAEMGKIGVSVSRANPQRVYAIIEAEKSVAGLYRSDNGGDTWAHMTNNALLTSRSWYYTEVEADPVNADVVYVLNSPLTKSIDGGKNFSVVPVRHIDTHDLWINPKYPNNMILGDDGGAEITYDGAKSWSTQDNQPTSQFYRVITDAVFPYKVYGGQQDNTSVIIASRNNFIGLTDKDWSIGPGCESAFVAFDPNNPVLLYGGCYQGIIDVLNTADGHVKDIRQYPANILAYDAKDMKYRFNWNAPLIASPHDYSTIYHGGNILFKTTNGGLSWEEISPDLTRDDSSKQGPGGAPITNEGAGGENYNTLSYVIESVHEKGVIYTGSDCGLVHITKDGGKTWQNITPAGLPESLIQSIEVSPHDKGTAFIAATRYKFNDYSNMSFKTTDYGKTWTKIDAGVEKDDFIKVIREDRKVKDLLYAGAERGFYVSFNGGTNWQKLQLNLPIVPVTDITFAENDLVISTAGRAFWILDDISALQQSKGNFAGLKVFTPKPTYKYEGYTPSWMDVPHGIGKNPMPGVILDYYLPEAADSLEVKLEILDASGKVIRTYSSIKDEEFKPFPGGPAPAQVIPAKKGINRIAWDFRGETLLAIPNAFVYGDYSGHRRAPGKYKARLTFKGAVAEAEIDLRQDPNLKNISAQDWAAQQALLENAAKSLTEIHQSVIDMRKVKSQIEHHNALLKDKEEAKALYQAGQDLIQKLVDWEAKLVETRQKSFQDVINFPSQLNAQYFDLRAAVDVHDPRLTAGAKQRLQDLDMEWAGYKTAMNQLIEKDIVEYNQKFKAQNLPAVIMK
ncbi:Glycosyl hydrolase, BNR repeat precursor [Mariniradius saccharolyticus AK6]|uniref:Glycosyl hydrolase, BNR repeat n=1 Tax=Mariniradius saccharolyticus AK6 TaxID=1239962 RepID=M7XHF9_9BACT|nr:glycosyl hydrolase BNR repeat precursor [Mariniradius saccharolyticus]EMS33973.1 Glycosyl hydrolase, BNR repeat precursor [Mariniradius saccharolyticus AK6]